MKQRRRIYYSESQKALMRERWRKGESLQHIAQLVGHRRSASRNEARSQQSLAIPSSDISEIAWQDKTTLRWRLRPIARGPRRAVRVLW
ncbi:hypothetical protein FSB65_04075 [Paraburkholderia sp. JPY418]|nr:hypothetical protein [Paraburkholderia youngii]